MTTPTGDALKASAAQVNEDALDNAAREGYAIRCKTYGPRTLQKYASDEIMQMQLDNARVIVSAYLAALPLVEQSQAFGLVRELLQALCGELRTNRGEHQDLINRARAALSPVEQAPQPVASTPARWELQRTSDGRWIIITEDEAQRFASQGRTVRALYPAPTEAPPVESQAAGWQPITTAPISNGSNSFLAYITGHGPHVCYAGAGRYIYSVSTGKRIHRATHWMTFPPPPALAAEGSAE